MHFNTLTTTKFDQKKLGQGETIALMENSSEGIYLALITEYKVNLIALKRLKCVLETKICVCMI